MAINLNPSRVNIQSGNAGKSGVDRRGASPEKPIIPTRAAENNIPAPETLSTLIRSAITALRSGTFWDRGTIVNLVV